MGKRKSTAEDKAGEMDVDGDSSDDVGHFIKKNAIDISSHIIRPSN
jgi:hypothetical protein